MKIDSDLSRDSYYSASAVRGDSWPALEGDVRCDVAVVGGGLAGLTAALELAERGHQVTLLEARQVGSGASGRNGGQAIHGLACEPEVIEKQLGQRTARQVWEMTFEAIDLIHERRTRHAIDCEWQSGHLGLATNVRKAAALRRWADRMERVYEHSFQWIDNREIDQWIHSPRFYAGIHDPRSGHLHPLKYTLGLARAAGDAGVRICEHTPVERLERGRPATLLTPRGKVVADQVLLAGNVHQPGLAPELASRIMPVGTYIVCTEPLPPSVLADLLPTRAAVCDSNFVLDYFRPTADNRLLYGGQASYDTRTPRRLAEAMKARLVRTFPGLQDVRIAHAWGGFVDISRNRAPDFGRLPGVGADRASRAPNVYYLQGFSGHGLALAGLAGRLVAQALHGDSARFDVFARLQHRTFPGGPWLRTPALMLAMAWHRLKDLA